MNTLDIIKFVKHYKKNGIFKGVFACDDLPNKVNKPSAFIINLSKKSEIGTHWIALYIDVHGHAYYFDSFGVPPKNRDIIFFIKNNAKEITYNKKQLQHITSSKCGKFCCAFVISVLTNKPISNFLSKFSSNLYVNDIIIDRIYKYFEKKSNRTCKFI